MRGCRPLSKSEILSIASTFQGPSAARDAAIFDLGRLTGERIGAILGLKVGDVFNDGKVADSVTYRRATRKGKIESRTIILNPKVKATLQACFNEISKDEPPAKDTYLFRSRKGTNRPISRVQYHRIFKCAVANSKILGKVATHSMRKTFAQHIYKALGKDLVRLQKALGHKNINSTVQYLSFDEADIDRAVLSL